MKQQQKPLEPKYELNQADADLIHKFAKQIGSPLIHYNKDKIIMLEEFVEQARVAALNITYHLHRIDAKRYEWTNGKESV